MAPGSFFLPHNFHQLCWSSIYLAVVVGCFFSSMALMEGKGVSGVIDNLNTVCLRSHSSIWPCIDFTIEVCTNTNAGMVRNVYLYIFSSTWPTRRMYRAVFTPAQIINFALVPPQFRFVFVSTVSLFWSVYYMFRFFRDCCTDSSFS